MGREAFVGLDWVGPALAAAVTLTGMLVRPGEASALVLVGVATCFSWNAVGRALLASRRLGDARRTRLLRWTSLAQGNSVAGVCAVLLWLGHGLSALAVLAVGVGLAALTWPWSWRLEQAADDRDRDHDSTLCSQHLVAAVILLVLTIGSAVALGGIAWLMLLALVVSSVVDAWDERRRPSAGREVDQEAVAAVPEPSRRAPAVRVPTLTAELPVVRRDDPRRGARSHQRAGRRAQQRYRGRRVATRRR